MKHYIVFQIDPIIAEENKEQVLVVARNGVIYLKEPKFTNMLNNQFSYLLTISLLIKERFTW